MAILKVTLGIAFLTGGCGIYLLFRTKTLNIYQWCVSLRLANMIDALRYTVHDWNIPDFVRYSLPDGLYVAAYILIMDAIWQDDDSLIKQLVIALIPAVTITSEIFQYFGLIKGTFDVTDLFFYSAPYIAYYINKYQFKFNNLKIQRL